LNWYAIYTKPKAEDAVSRKLRQAGIEVYNPRLRVKKYLQNQYRQVIEPLFPCYLFAQFEPDKYLWIITYTRGVKRVLGSKTEPWPVAEEVIDFIRSHEKDGLIIRQCDDIRDGDSVKIAEGPLAGLTGIFKQIIKGTERVILLLNAIEYQARVIVERASLMKV
jgi:transcriptional antiterminator RfaH